MKRLKELEAENARLRPAVSDLRLDRIIPAEAARGPEGLRSQFTREGLTIRIGRRLRSTDVIDVLSDLFILRGAPGHVRSDNGPEFAAKAACERIAAVGSTAAFIEPGSPWETGYRESFNASLRDELLDGGIFYSLAAADRRPSDQVRGQAAALSAISRRFGASAFKRGWGHADVGDVSRRQRAGGEPAASIGHAVEFRRSARRARRRPPGRIPSLSAGGGRLGFDMRAVETKLVGHGARRGDPGEKIFRQTPGRAQRA